ncbi:hypothetical protein INR49_000298 [Caranx melampygus]|nr:hypothetical protein INR49_000298 [Caranx melampygus]
MLDRSLGGPHDGVLVDFPPYLLTRYKSRPPQGCDSCVPLHKLGEFRNKDDQRKVPKPVCRTNVPPAPGHASLGQEETVMVRGRGLPRSSAITSWRAQTAPSVGTAVNGALGASECDGLSDCI